MQKKQDDAKYSILWVGVGWVEYLQQVDEEVYKYASAKWAR